MAHVSARPTPSDRAAGRLVADVLGVAVGRVERLAVGHGNANWRVTTGDGDVVLKVGPPESATKWASADQARRSAADVGVPVPERLHAGDHDVGVVRVFRWVEGERVDRFADDAEALDRFATDLARAVAALHGCHPAGFSSRLDGSAATFADWHDYVAHRWEQVRRRAVTVGAPAPDVLDRVGAVIAELAVAVSPLVEPAVCHRDLHPDNLVVGPGGHLAAILDWDMAEAWDPAGDWWKLDGQLLPLLGGAAASFVATYGEVHPVRPAWAERRRLVGLLEGANAVANAGHRGWVAYGAEAHARLLADLTA